MSAAPAVLHSLSSGAVGNDAGRPNLMATLDGHPGSPLAGLPLVFALSFAAAAGLAQPGAAQPGAAQPGAAQPGQVDPVLAQAGQPSPGRLQQHRNSVEGFPLTSSVRAKLATLQEVWLQWDSAFLRSDQDEAERATSVLLATASDLGMSRLPDLSVAILARALEAAGRGNVEPTRWALAMAEKLDPGRPETRFAGAAVSRIEGKYLGMFADLWRGYSRMARDSFLLADWTENLLIWSLTTLLLCGGLFLCLQIVVHGGAVVRDLTSVFTRGLPVALSYALALLCSIWPILLPSGWRWLLLYWAVLLSRYASRSERVVVAAVVVLLLATPSVLRGQQDRVGVDWSASMRAVRGLETGRLYSGLFKDVELLLRALPENAAVVQLAADLHLGLGQTEFARTIYQQLLEEQPRNAAVHNNLGAYHYLRREYGEAIEHLETAMSIEPETAEPYYNLSQVHGENPVAIEEAVRALNKARQLAPERVAEWQKLERMYVSLRPSDSALFDEIRNALIGASRAESAKVEASPWTTAAGRRSLPLLGCLLIAGILLVLVSRIEGRPSSSATNVSLHLTLVAVPGLASMRLGLGFRAFGALLLVLAPVVLLRAASLGYRVQWGFLPSSLIPWFLAGVALTVLFAVRWWLEPRQLGQ